ncbi:hypothetical protein GCM10020000_73690 [Streptomyces olivoverticillatus]
MWPPDYVLTDPETARGLEAALAEAIEALYGPDPASHPEYGRIVNTRHFERLTALLDSGRTVTGGGRDRDAKYIAPTVLAGVAPDAPVMREEIFGPILPIVEVDGLDEAIDLVNERDKPLALYAFTESETTRRAAGRGNLLGRSGIRAAAGPSDRLRPAVRRGGGERHGQLPRPVLHRDVQPPQGRAPQAPPLNRRTTRRERAAQSPGRPPCRRGS